MGDRPGVHNKKAIIDLPIKLILTEEGINFFIRSQKKLNRFKMADNVEDYGIQLERFSPQSVQRMILINYVSQIELAKCEFTSRRREIMDVSKLIVYGTLYRHFDTELFKKVLQSELIQKWNRINPGNIIDARTHINEKYLENVLKEKTASIYEIKKMILAPVNAAICTNKNLLPEEKNVQLFLSEKFLDILRPFTWFILTKFSESLEFRSLLIEIRELLVSFMEKSRIAEYMSLMVMELAIHAENENMQAFARRMYKGEIPPQSVLYDPEIRKQVIDAMNRRKETVFLSWKIGGKSGSIGTQNRLRVTVYNKKSEYQKLKEDIEGMKSVNTKKKSLLDFYKELPEDQSSTELGLYYLSYLNEACEKVNVKLESLVNQIRESELTVITMTLHL